MYMFSYFIINLYKYIIYYYIYYTYNLNPP